MDYDEDIRAIQREYEEEARRIVAEKTPLVKSNALTMFVKKYCKNWDADEKGCALNVVCWILRGERCGYFKKAVWPICDPSQKFATETKLYAKLLPLYKKIEPNISESDAVIRRCECGEMLGYRQRLCPDCRKRHRKETYKRARRRAG